MRGKYGVSEQHVGGNFVQYLAPLSANDTTIPLRFLGPGRRR